MILLIKTIDGANNVAIVAIRKKLDEYPNAIFSTRREIKIEQKWAIVMIDERWNNYWREIERHRGVKWLLKVDEYTQKS